MPTGKLLPQPRRIPDSHRLPTEQRMLDSKHRKAAGAWRSHPEALHISRKKEVLPFRPALRVSTNHFPFPFLLVKKYLAEWVKVDPRHQGAGRLGPALCC